MEGELLVLLLFSIRFEVESVVNENKSYYMQGTTLKGMSPGVLKEPLKKLIHNESFCKSGFAFRSLRSCRGNCSYAVGKSVELPPEESVHRRFQYKAVMFFIGEYKICPHNRVLEILDDNTTVKVFSKEDYFLFSDNSSVVCYPLDQSFYVCNKDQISSGNYTLTNRNRSLQLELTNRNRTLLLEKKSFDVANFFLYEQFAYVCLSNGEFNQLDIIHLVGCAISIISLPITFFICLKIQKLNLKLNNALLCHIAMLFCSFLILSTKYMTSLRPKYFCLATALLQQFAFLSAFYWLNVQSFNLCTSFALLVSLKVKHKASKRYLIYSALYAWGIPLFITIATFLAEFFEIRSIMPYLEQNCWFLMSDRNTAFLFFYGPMAATLVVNILFFIRITFHFRKVGKEVSVANKNIYNQLFALSIRLMVVMGFYWFIKIIYWKVGETVNAFAYMDAVTYFQGFLVFIVYVCKPSMFSKLTSSFRLRRKTLN